MPQPPGHETCLPCRRRRHGVGHARRRSAPQPHLAVLSALGRHGVKAVFFVVGTNAKAQPSLLRDISGAGHLIGNHTWDHPDLSRLSTSAVRDQLERTRDVIAQ